MKRHLTGIATLSVATLLLASTAFAGPLTKRAARQRARIHHGAQSGELTRGETAVLRGQQRHIQSLRQAALTDGHIGPREAQALTRAQNRANRDIYRLKHNDRETGWAQ